MSEQQNHEQPTGPQPMNMMLRFMDGHEETFSYTPNPDTGLGEGEDFKGRLSQAMKSGLLRMLVDDGEVLVFTASLAYIENKPATMATGTFPWTFHRVSAGNGSV